MIAKQIEELEAALAVLRKSEQAHLHDIHGRHMADLESGPVAALVEREIAELKRLFPEVVAEVAWDDGNRVYVQRGERVDMYNTNYNRIAEEAETRETSAAV